MAIILTTDDTRREVFLKAEQAKVQTGGGSTSIAMRVDGGYIQYSADNGKTWTNLIAEADLKGAPGKDGAPGKTPEAGVDYFTEADKQAIAAEAAKEVGFPKPTSADNGMYLGCENGAAKWLPVEASGGGVQFTTDETLSLKDGVLSVNTAHEPEPDNTLPITSAAVHTTVGNIEIILQTI